MPCPKCNSQPFLDEYDRDFRLTRYHVDIGEPASFQVESEIETLLQIDGDKYRVEPLADEDPEHVRTAVEGLLQEDTFDDIVDSLPENVPQAYDDDSYLSRHLSEDLRSELERIAAEHGLTPRVALLLGFVESKNRVLGKADDTLTRYIEARDSLARNLDAEGGVTPRIQRELVAHLLLATALIEELAADAIFREMYREEHRLGENRNRLKHLPQDQRLRILKQNGIISNRVHSKVQRVKELRDSLVHDARRRTAMKGQHDKEWLDAKLEEIDETVAGILDITGKTAARIIAENGPVEYINEKRGDAIRETKRHWQDEHAQFSLLESCKFIESNELAWEIHIGSAGHRNVSEGVDFSELPDDETEATTNEIRLYDTLMEFLRSCEDFLVRRIERNLEKANLDRQDFLVLCLLCAEENSYEDVARVLGTTVEYVQRKENVLAWRSSEFEKEEFGELPKPDEPVGAFTRDGRSN